MTPHEVGGFTPETQIENIDPGFIDFDKYKKLGGEMSQEDYLAVQRQRENMQMGLEKIMDLGKGLPTAEMALIFSKIASAFPKKSGMWLLVETYCCMGKE